MQMHELQQGSQEWHEHRAKFFNASDAPAMMGCSPYKTRDQLLFEKFTGLTPEITAFNQKIFDEGHRYEALARPLAEEIIGDDLMPAVITDGDISASLDGKGFILPVNWENKTLNQDIKVAFERDEIPKYIRIQVEQQMRIDAECQKTLITASKFDEYNQLVEILHKWYLRDDALWQEILEEKLRFEQDLKTYVPDYSVPVFSAPAAGAPMVSVQAEGRVIQSNLPVVIEYVEKEKENLGNIIFQTDEDYEFAGNKGKEYRNLQECAKRAKESMLEGTIAIGEAVRQLDYIYKLSGEMALHLEKAVKQNKINKQTELIVAGNQNWQKIVAELEKNLDPLKITVPMPDFAEAMKGKRTVASFISACNDALDTSRKSAVSMAQELGANLALYGYVKEEYGFLFEDFQQIAYKSMQEFKTILDGRIANYKAAEAEKKAKLEAEMKRQAEIEEAARQAAVVAAAEKQRLDNEKMRLESEKQQREKEEKHSAELAAVQAQLEKEKQARIQEYLDRAKALNRTQGESHANQEQKVLQENQRPEPDQQATVTTKNPRSGRAATTADLVLLIQKSWGFSEGGAHALIRFAAEELTAKQAA